MSEIQKFTCRVRVALLGFEKGHEWRPIMYNPRGVSTAMTCIRCGENGWEIHA